MSTPYSVARWLSPFADWGYVVVASQYRGAAGSEGKDESGGADVNDVLNLFPLLTLCRTPTRPGLAWPASAAVTRDVSGVNENRQDQGSSGRRCTGSCGFPARRSAAEATGLPTYDLEDFCLRQLLPNYDRDRQKIIDARSPIKWPDKLHRKTPILMLHGTSDWDALAYGSLDMAAALLKRQHPFRLLMLEGGDHDLVRYDDEVNRSMKAGWTLCPRRQNVAESGARKEMTLHRI